MATTKQIKKAERARRARAKKWRGRQFWERLHYERNEVKRVF